MISQSMAVASALTLAHRKDRVAEILHTRITRGLQDAQLDTVPRNTREVSPLVH